MKNPLEHNKWIREQFTPKYKKSSYRNVLIHTGLIENIIEKEARYKENFSVAIKILRFSYRYKQDYMDEIDKLRNLRNKIIHRVEVDKLEEKDILNIRDNMYKLLKKIYHNSPLIQKYFQKNYQIDTKKF